MSKAINPNMLCMGCMRERENLQGPCQFCGFDEGAQAGPSYHLPCRSILNGKYLVGRVLGEGGFGITYLGWDLNLDMKVAIKEYYPSGLVTRQAPGVSDVVNYGGEKAVYFDSGKNKFMDEAKTLAKFYAMPGIVSVKDFFMESNTSYIVMEYLDGMTLKQYLKVQGGRIPVQVVINWMRPVIHSMAKVHKAGLIHRDISPDNIMLTTESGIKLLDFGSARDVSPDGERSLSVLLKPGYAPEEQYRSHGNQGAWTDVYALCATIYKCMTGETPPEPLERMIEDSLVPPSKLGVVLPEHQEKAILKGLSLRAEDRYQSMEELEAALYGDAVTGQGEQAVVPVRVDLPYKSAVLEKADNKTDGKIDDRISGDQEEEKKETDTSWEELRKLSEIYKTEGKSGEKREGNAKKKKILAAAAAVIFCIVLAVGLHKGESKYGNSPCNLMLNGGYMVKAAENKYIYADMQAGKGNLSGIKVKEVIGLNKYYIPEDFMNEPACYFSVWDDLLYYKKWEDSSLYRSTLRGTDETKILEDCLIYQIVDGDIFYVDTYGGLYLTDINGEEKTELTENTVRCFAVRKGEVYYTEGGTDGNRLCSVLYKSKKDGKERELLAYLDTEAFVVDKDYIYTFQENGGIGYYIEKISMDGQKRENTGIAVNGTVFNITEDQIYYSNAEDNGCLYKANKDGTQKRKVSDLIPRSISVLEYKNYSVSERVVCLGDDNKWYDCYYSEPELVFERDTVGEAEETTNSEVFAEESVKVDSAIVINGVKYGNIPCNVMQSGGYRCAVLGNDGTYFDTNGYVIIKGNISDTGKAEEYRRGEAKCLNIWDGWLYYICNSNLYRENIKNKSEEMLIRSIEAFQIVGGTIYYTSEGKELISAPIDNISDRKILKEDVNSSWFSIEDNWVYCTSVHSNRENKDLSLYSLFKIDVNGNSEQKIAEIPGDKSEGAIFCVLNGIIYYSEESEGTYLLKTMNTEGIPKEIPEVRMCYSDAFQIAEDSIYYIDSEDSLVKVPLDGSKVSEKIFDGVYGSFYQVGDRFHIYTDNCFYSIDFNGRNKTILYNFNQ
ncbi:DUF5050 domain-containing protein [Murimonas intestini]|uniref:DUF5050 domain-containing protein n=1 Tax=Murimonas intestini TaxID=1337051 RepID=UPI0016529746|nr:DUF5050 domain-containing protein [Murimonas intestini]